MLIGGVKIETVYENKRIHIVDTGDAYSLFLKKNGLTSLIDKSDKILQGIIDYADSGGRFGKSHDTAICLWIDYKPCSLARLIYALSRDVKVSELPSGRILFTDGDKTNCRVENLYSPSVSIYHDDKRIYIKHSQCKERFFTNYEPELFDLLKSPCFSWYYNARELAEGEERQLLSSMVKVDGKKLFGSRKVYLSGVVWAYFHLGMHSNNIIESIEKLHKVYKDGDVIDHLRDNSRNNCNHNLSRMSFGQNSAKKRYITQIQLPYVFVPVYVDGSYRVLCGKAKIGGWVWYKLYRCGDAETFVKMLSEFMDFAKYSDDMRIAITDGLKTNCLSQMVTDDGNGEIQSIIDASPDCFEPYDGGRFTKYARDI